MQVLRRPASLTRFNLPGFCCVIAQLLISLFASADVENMAIDWLTGNMYFVDRVADKIFACDQRGETCVTIVQLDLQNPKGVAVDPLLG